MIYSAQATNQAIDKMNSFGTHRVPFLFLFNYELDEIVLYPLDDVPDHIQFAFLSHHKKSEADAFSEPFQLKKTPISKDVFSKAFRGVMDEIEYGNSFLLNLTFPSKINTNHSLKEIFHQAQAKYKVLWEGRFTSFSPETFVKIRDNKIYSYPMKGTIDAKFEDAAQTILNDPKEAAEHYTIVDLIRNDLAQVAEQIKVNKFRFIDKIQAHDKTLLQVSSEIEGSLAENWQSKIGTLLMKLLPAGSISGAPKKRTLEIIRKNEIDRRGFYTGVAGVFDGETIDSCVLIRFIEQKDDQLFFRSGGGITFQSDLDAEYEELIQKIYVPIF